MKAIQSASLSKIDEVATNLGIKQDDKTILEITENEDGKKTLNLKCGSFDAPEPWFVIDEKDKVHTLISIASLKNMLEALKNLQKDNFELRLEKAINQQLPIDFNDAWCVAMDEIKKQAKNGALRMNIDLEKLMSDVKREHPNLFVDMEMMMQKGGFE